MKNNRIPLLVISILLWNISPAFALFVPHVFGDHMVLQAGMPVAVWGWAEPGEAISVRFAGQEKHATAATEAEPTPTTRTASPIAGLGRWQVELDPLKVSSEPGELTISGKESVTFKDVLVGEVWLCAGQSNMQKPVGTWRGQPVCTIDYQKELAAANYPCIRLMNEEISNAVTPAPDVDIHPRSTDYPWKGWVPCTPASLDEVKFSAAGYFFARKLSQDLGVPIGMIEASAGGTHIEAWTPAAGFTADPALADFVQAARTPNVKYQGTTICTLYNGMIHPILPFALRGVLWYQGESNLTEKDGAIYANKQAALINSWRAAWGRDLPFYFVQLPPHLYSARATLKDVPYAEPIFREAQAEALKLPHTGMVVTTDVGDLKNIHPAHKKEVGERLALWALAEDYGRKIEPSGPIYRSGSIEHEGYKAVLHFDHVDGGLVSSDGKPLDWFTTAGEDGNFYPAKAEISGDAIVITCPQVPEPKVVRFAWDETAMPNFFNKAGLPAVPFRTDSPFGGRRQGPATSAH